MLIGRPKNGCYEAWKSCAAAEVGPAPGRGWRVAEQLRRVENVSTPDLSQAISAYEVDAPLPPGQQRHKFPKTRQLFRRDAHFIAKFVGPVSPLLRVAFHVKRQRGLCRCACA